MKTFLLAFFVSCLAFAATLTEGEKQQFYTTNIVKNSGFENDLFGWSTSVAGTLTRTKVAGSYASGLAGGKWASGSASGYLETALTALPAGLQNRQCGLSVMLKGGSSSISAQILDQSGNVLVSQTLQAYTDWYGLPLPFPCGTATSVKARFVTDTTDSSTLFVDDAFIGDAYRMGMLGNISQARFVGSLEWAPVSACQWITNSLTAATFSADLDCDDAPRIATGDVLSNTAIGAADGTFPKIKVKDQGAGTYRIVATGYFDSSQAGVSSSNTWLFKDSFDTIRYAGGHFVPGLTVAVNSIQGEYVYASSGDREFSIGGIVGTVSSSLRIGVQTSRNALVISVYYYPSSTQVAQTPETTATSWSGYHGLDCSWSRTNTLAGSFTADSTCTFADRTNNNFGSVTSSLSGSDKLPGIVFTPKQIGQYYICAAATVQSSTATNVLFGIQMRTNNYTTLVSTGSQRINTNGSNPDGNTMTLCGILEATNLNAKTVELWGSASSGAITINSFYSSTSDIASIEWTIFNITQSFPNPMIMNSVATPASGGVKVVSARIGYTAPSYAVVASDGNFISTISKSGTGQASISFVAGTFSNTPACTATSLSGAKICSLNSPLSTGVNVFTKDYSDVYADSAFHIICVGTK